MNRTLTIQSGISSTDETPLTTLDESTVPWGYTSRFWFYKVTLDENTMTEALRNTLKIFPTLCGSLKTKENKHSILHDDKGAQMEVVHSSKRNNKVTDFRC